MDKKVLQLFHSSILEKMKSVLPIKVKILAMNHKYGLGIES